MEKQIIAICMFTVLLALFPLVIWLWIICIDEIKKQIKKWNKRKKADRANHPM